MLAALAAVTRNIVTTDNAWTGANFRRGGYLDHADRYKHAEAFVETAKRIWDSWETAAGPARRVLHEGQNYTVDVTPRLPRSAQYRPVLFQVGDSPEGRNFAARQADVVFSAPPKFDDAVEFRKDLVERSLAAGRGATSETRGSVFHGAKARQLAEQWQAEAKDRGLSIRQFVTSKTARVDATFKGLTPRLPTRWLSTPGWVRWTGSTSRRG